MSLALVFPGQGSQYVGMLADLAGNHPEVNKTFNEASDVLGYDLWALCQQGPAEELDKTIHTQPALLTASYAIWRIYQKLLTHSPAYLAGHSLGEYTALVCAGSLKFKDAVKLVAARGQYMQEAIAAGTGAMAALIGLENKIVEQICVDACMPGEVLSPANYNSIGQIVIAGHKASIDKAITLAKEQGAKMAILIPVSVPSHCRLMSPAAERLKTLLETIEFHQPQMPVINNVDVKAYTNNQDIRDGLIRQLSQPVRWVETIQFLVRQGVKEVLECGPGKVLTGLNKRIEKSLQLGSVLS